MYIRQLYMIITLLCVFRLTVFECPVCSCDQVLAKQLTHYYGNITAENTIQGIVPIVQTGDVHVAVYDLTEQVCVCVCVC